MDGAKAPTRDDLPPELGALARRHALRIDHDTFRADSATLLRHVVRIVAEASEREEAREKQPHLARRERSWLERWHRNPTRRRVLTMSVTGGVVMVVVGGLIWSALTGPDVGNQLPPVTTVPTTGQVAPPPARGEVRMPELVGLTERDARDRLAELGFQGIQIDRDQANDSQTGTVLEQSVPAGELVSVDQQITLGVGTL